MTTTTERSSTADPRAVEIIRELEARGRQEAAERVAYLLGLDGDDPDEQPLNVESLQWFAELLKRCDELPDPRIGVKPDGLIQIEWLLNPDGIVALTFRSDGMIRVYAAFDESEGREGCAPVNGTLTAAEADAAINVGSAKLAAAPDGGQPLHIRHAPLDRFPSHAEISGLEHESPRVSRRLQRLVSESEMRPAVVNRPEELEAAG